MRYLKIFFLSFFMFNISVLTAQNDTVRETINEKKTRVYQFDIKEEIAPPVWRTTQRAFEKANEWNADIMLIIMNTYGGMVVSADSIRTKILNSKIPVYVLIDNNAASAGALIAIACDSIYMVSGANIGAATVVDQGGDVVSDKYQSYMRSMMRSTAEATGRNPEIAQAMVDPDVNIPNVSDSAKILTFTTSEAIKHGFCQAKTATIEEIMQRADVEQYEIKKHETSWLDKLINFLISPAISGILIMLIIGGIYFELQTPGVGFPLVVAVLGALLYFAPHYIEGLASHWEMLIFIAGVALLLVELFAIPGFGVIGISGIVLIVFGLSFAMVEEIDFIGFTFDFSGFSRAFFTVIISMFLAISISIWLSKKLLTTSLYGQTLALNAVQEKEKGFTSASDDYEKMIGAKGFAFTILRPSGKVKIANDVFDATAESGYIDQDTPVEVVGYQTGQLFVRKTTISS